MYLYTYTHGHTHTRTHTHVYMHTYTHIHQTKEYIPFFIKETKWLTLLSEISVLFLRIIRT
jgi:hypothetical protein